MPDDRPPFAPIVVFYHRPYEDPFHGGSVHFRGFVDGLRSTLPLSVVAPPVLPPSRSGGERSSVLLAGLRYLLRSTSEGLRFFATQCFTPAERRARVLVSFDIYPAGLAAVWARIFRIPFVYYPQDSNREVSRSWAKSGYRGGQLFRWFRRPLEDIALRSADLVVAPSDAVRAVLEQEGVAPGRLTVCTLKREPPTFRSEDVTRWRQRLGLNGAPAAIFLGSFQYPPNLRAFEFLRSTVASGLREAGSRLVLVVAGLGSEAFSGEPLENLRMAGTVEDIDGLLFACSIGLAPMDVAGGTSGKIVDYVLHGLTTLATPEAARGVASTPLLQVVPLQGFLPALAELASKIGKVDAPPSAPRAIDPVYAAMYTNTDDLGRVADEIARLGHIAVGRETDVRRA